MFLTIDSTYCWLILAAVLAVIEINTASLVCIWFVAGSVFAFAASFITESIWVQMAVFSIVSGVCLAVTRPLAAKIMGKKPVATNADRLIGSHCIVTEDILPDEKGRVKADGVFWQAQSDVPLKAGETVEVLSISGATLTVTPVTVKNI